MLYFCLIFFQHFACISLQPSNEKEVNDNLVNNPLYLMRHLCCYFQDSVFVWLFEYSLNIVHLHMGLFEFINVLGMYIQLIPQTWRIFSLMFWFSTPGLLMIHVLFRSMIFQRSHRLCALLFILCS